MSTKLRFAAGSAAASVLAGTAVLIGSPATANAAPSDCPKAAVLVSEGTWSTGTAQAPANGSMLSPLLKLKSDKVDVWFNPYPAQYRMPGNNLMSYDDSKKKGVELLSEKSKQVYKKCGKKTKQYWVGYSQGGQVTADLAQNPPVPVAEATVIADPRFTKGVGRQVGVQTSGVGALTLPVFDLFNNFVRDTLGQTQFSTNFLDSILNTGLNQFVGANFAGPRSSNFKIPVNQICGRGDGACDMQNAPNLVSLLTNLAFQGPNFGRVHASYQTPEFWSKDGKSAVQWTEDRIHQVLKV